MIISEAKLKAIMPRAMNSRAAEFVRSFNLYSGMFGIDSPLRVAHFLAQVAHETAELRYLEEIASGAAYEGRKDLGNTFKGDGKRFKGRGCLQLTGRANYQKYADSPYCNGDLMSHPEWLSKFPGALKSAMWYWLTRNLNRFADRDDIKGASKAINGGYNGLAERKKYWLRAKQVFNI